MRQIAEEPTEVFAGAGFKASADVIRGGMLEAPLGVIVFHGLVEKLLTQVVLEVAQCSSCFFVHDGAVVDRRKVVGMALHGLCFLQTITQQGGDFIGRGVAVLAGADQFADVVGQDTRAKTQAIAVLFNEVARFVVRVEAFIEPRVLAFVASQNAVEPVVSDFVNNHGFERKGSARVANYRDVGVFHASTCADGAVNGGAVVVGVVAHVARVVCHAVVEVLRTACPKVGIGRGKH